MLRLTFLMTGMLACGLQAEAQDWTEFRGPDGQGRFEGESGIPSSWSETNHVAWKTAIPHLGWSTPVVMNEKIWVTSATKEGHDYYAYAIDAETGEILFEKHLFHCDKPEPLGNSVNCYASPSAVVEAGRVYVHFGSYGTACLDTETAEVIWKRDDMPCRHYRGPGSSAILHDNLLILTFDGVDLQYLTALDKQTGKTVWRADRDVDWKDLDAKGKPKSNGDFRKAFTTPIVIDVEGQKQLISPASNVIFAYDPATGKELWKVIHGNHSASLSPIFSNGLVISITGNRGPELLGICPDGTGDVSNTHVAWRFAGKDVPTTPSPVAVDGLLYMVSNRGTVNCLDVKTGESVWRERVGGNYIASPVVIGNRVLFCSSNGKATVIKTGRTYEELAENHLDDGFMSSPSILGDSMILRTKTHLYCIKQ